MINKFKYRGLMPKDTHFRKGTCEEARCPNFIYGWETILDATDEKLLHICRTSGRKYVEEREGIGFIKFTFEAGQQCFQPHWIQLDREPILSVVRTGQSTLSLPAEDWVDHFAENQAKLKEIIERG